MRLSKFVYLVTLTSYLAVQFCKVIDKPKIDVIIPAFNEENSVGKVVRSLPKNWVREVIVVNNNSNDATPKNALEAGATVIDQQLQGYGYACLKGIEYIAQKTKEAQPDIVVFIDADFSDYPEELPLLVQPIISDTADFIIGSRALGERKKGAMQPHQQFGNWLATSLIWMFYKVSFTDLGPFRAVKWLDLVAMDMQDTTYGWTVEMQVKAAKHQLRCAEVPVSYRVRIGKSKITGTIKGTVLAGYKIITTIFKYL